METLGGNIRSSCRVILRRTGFKPNSTSQFNEWNQTPKIKQVTQGERIRFLKLMAKNKNYNDTKL